MDQILHDLDEVIMPGVTHWNHPRFFGYFANSSPPPAIAAELVSAALNSNAMLWRTSPAATELELVVCGWLADFLGLPPMFGTINDTASTSTFYAMVAARHRAFPEVRTRGMRNAPAMAVYASDQAHSSVDKAVLAAGLGSDSVRKIPSDGELRMDVGALERAISEDLSTGILPLAVVATVGTTAATSVDPVADIASLCERYGAWLHVDAAYAGPAAALPEFQWIFEGVERADSVVVNPHKWLFVPIDLSVQFLREPDSMREAFSIVPDYLETKEDATNLMDYGISLGRRFRALKMWMVFRSMGTEKMREAIREHIRLGALLASWVDDHPDFERLAPALFSVVNFRYRPNGASGDLNSINAGIVDAVNASGEVFLTTASIRGDLAIHAAIGNLGTSEQDVEALWAAITRAAGATTL